MLLALNNSATSGRVALSGALGGAMILFVDYLSLFGAASIAVALMLTELAHRYMVKRARHGRSPVEHAEDL